MIEKRTVIDQITVMRDGTVLVRFALEVAEDGHVISQQWHRTSIPPGADPDAQIAAVNDDITVRPSLKYPAVVDENLSMDTLRAVCSAAHTTELIDAYNARQAAAAADLTPAA